MIHCDTRDRDSITSAFVGMDTVFHAAALTRFRSGRKPIETHVVNAVGTPNVLIAARDAGVRRVVYSGPSSVCRDQEPLRLREDMTHRLNPYALQKLVGEQ